MPTQNHLGTALFISLLILLLCTVTTTTAVNVNESTYFQTTESKAQYYISACNFTLNNVSCYPTALSFNGGNLTTYSESGAWIVMSLQNEADKTNYTDTIYFTNDIEAKYINITDNFANFSITSGKTYLIKYQATGAVYQTSTATAGEIKFSAIPAGAWYISAPYGTGIHGFVVSYPSYEVIGGATVNLWNGTGYTNSTTALANGYYVFENLTWDYTVITNETFNSSAYDTWITLDHTLISGDTQLVSNTTDETAFYNITDYAMNYTDGKININASGNMTNHTLYHIDYNYTGLTSIYSLNATASLHNTSADTDTTVTIDEYTQEDFYIAHHFTINAKDADTHATIEEFSAIWEDTHFNTSNGTITLATNLTAGDSIEIAAPYYHLSYAYAYYDSVTGTYPVYETIIYLERTSDYYAKHYVAFYVVTVFGDPVDGVYCNVTYSKPYSTAILTLNGTTGSDGVVTFEMVKDIKYALNFYKAGEVDETLSLYPKDTHYTILIMPTSSPYRPETNWYEAVNFTVSWAEINNTHAYINFEYNDTINETSSLTFYINNTDDNETNVWNFSYSGDCNLSTNQTIVNKEGGKSFYVGFYSTHITHGSLWKESVIKFKWWLDVGIPKSGCYVLSIAFLFLFGCFFGATSAHMGAVIIHLPAWIFYYIGWLKINNDVTTILVLSITTTIAVIAYITYRSRRVLNN